MARIGVVGLGAVGSAVKAGMEEYHQVSGYDIDGRGSFDETLHSDAILVCVPTDGLHDGRLDMSAICTTVERLGKVLYPGLLIIKSTLQPGTMDSMENEHPNLRLCYMPEFLREKDAYEWFANPDRLVVSGSQDDVAVALKLFDWVPENVPRLIMSHLEAELGKLAHNAYIATKVTFTCEIERMCEQAGADPENVMAVVWNDRRIANPSHLTPSLGGFDGKCVPKDTQALQSIDTDNDSLISHVLRLGNAKAVKERLGRR